MVRVGCLILALLLVPALAWGEPRAFEMPPGTTIINPDGSQRKLDTLHFGINDEAATLMIEYKEAAHLLAKELKECQSVEKRTEHKWWITGVVAIAVAAIGVGAGWTIATSLDK